MIFGTELEGYNKHGVDNEKMFVKSYWARDDIRYSHLFDDTQLFIVFGMAISKTDAWWFDRIYETLLNKEAELIIYNYCKEKPEVKQIADDEVKERFIHACIHHGTDPSANNKVRNQTYVIHFSTNDTNFLGFKK